MKGENTMKKISIILLTAVASFFFASVASAQTINETIIDPKNNKTLEFPNDNGVQIDNVNKVAYSKNISKPFSDGTYWIKLETFATGTAEKVVTSTPSDIILVLDLSSSMRNNDYTPFGNNVSRLQALRQIIRDFAITVYDNDAKARSVDEHYLGDRIAVIGYDRNASMISEGGWVYINDTDKGVTKTGDNYSGALLTSIASMDGDARTGTRPDHGFDMAITELLSGNTEATKKRDDANLTVLMFTDGYPTDNNATELGQPEGSGTNNGSEYKFEYPIANKALYYANQLKKSYGAKLYTIGLIDSETEADSWRYRNYCRVRQWMDWLSSNYPDAAWNDGVITSTTPMYFEDASDAGNHYSGYPSGSGTSFVYKGSNVPAPWNTTWTYNGGTITLNGFTAGETTTDGDKFTNDGDYCQIIATNSNDFSAIFQKISMQAAGTANEQLSPQASNLDMISNNFTLPDDVTAATVKQKIKIFTQKLTGINGNETEGYEYLFEEDEILAKYNTYQYPVYNSYGVQTGTKDIDDDIDVELVGKNGIKVTGFDYAANFCGKVTTGNTEEIQGWKIIIMIPIKMNPDAVGGPNSPTNGTGSGIYAEGSDTPLVEFKSPTVSLPVNVYIEKAGLEARESAKFKIERALIPTNEDGTPVEGWKPEDITSWEYVSTVFVTNSPNSSFTHLDTDGNLTAESNPMVRVKGMPATKVLKWVNPDNPNDYVLPEDKVKTDVTHTVPVQQGLVYKISEEPWSWSYTIDPEPKYTVTEKIDNPFSFTNTKRTDDNIDVTVRHAESKVMNVFNGGSNVGTAAQNAAIQYDDSKKNVGRENYYLPPTKPTTTGGEGGEGGGESGGESGGGSE